LISLITGRNAETEDYFFIHRKDLNMETIYRKFTPALLIAVYLMGNNFAMAAELAPVGGYVYSDSTPLCALVISNGQSQFSCDGTGRYDMQVPLDGNGMITVQAFASGFAPFKQILPPEQATEYLVNMQRVDQGRSLQVTASYSLGEEQRALVDGTVKSGGSPVCSLALANGQKTFSCGDDLGKFSLDVPLDENGNVTLMVFAAGFEPYKEITQVDPDSDGDGVKDRLDEDDDNDGILDVDDACPEDPNLACGIIDVTQPLVQLYSEAFGGGFFGDSFDEVSFPYSSSGVVNANVSGIPAPTTYSLGTFKLLAQGQNFTITNLRATDSTGRVAPYFTVLSNNYELVQGKEVRFELVSPLTKGSTVNLNFRFEVKETGDTFSASYTFKSN
jgi:hypothetical protein